MLGELFFYMTLLVASAWLFAVSTRLQQTLTSSSTQNAASL